MGLHSVWGPPIAWYLFLAGAGAGAYLVGAIAGFLGERYRPLVKPGVLLGAPLVAIGCLLLLVDLGVPARFMMVFLQPQTSMMSVGVIIITLFIVLAGVHWVLTLLKKGTPKLLRPLSVVAGIFAVGTAAYTGCLLALVQAIPFWHQPLLPVLFILSAFSTGIGAVFVALGIVRAFRPAAKADEVGEAGEGAAAEEKALVASAHGLGCVDLPIIAAELIVLFSMMFIIGSTNTVASTSVAYLVSGDYAVAFWLGIIIVGLAVPAVLEILSLSVWKGKASVAKLLNAGIVTGACLLIGGLILRFAIVSAGMNIAVLM